MPFANMQTQQSNNLYVSSPENYTRTSHNLTVTRKRLIQYKRPKNAKFYPAYFFDFNDFRMKSLSNFTFQHSEGKLERSVVHVANKLVHAAFIRSNYITDRVLRLSWKQNQIRKKLIIFQHAQNQKLIQLKATIHYKQILATMRRQSFIWKRVEQSAMRVEKAVTICNLRKLQKAQADSRLSSKSMVKKMTENAETLAKFTGSDKQKSKPPIDIKHLMPPVSRYTLRELDVVEIYSNMQLRHDLVFDADMAFRPNTDGDKGTVKQMRAAQYWNFIKEEVLAANDKSGEFKRMPLLINEIKEIMLEMFQDSTELIEGLKQWNIEKITDELWHDMDNGTQYLIEISKIMHIYCAPCRDELIDDMVALYQARFHVDALNKCLSILECMRLDFANHNLRKLRPLLVAKSAEYEWKYFQQKYEKKSIPFTKQWIAESCLDFKKAGLKNHFYEFAVMKIITNSYMSETGVCLPETFKFDKTRICSLHNDWQDISIMNTLLVLFKQFAGLKCTSLHLQSIKKVLWLLLNDTQTTMENIVSQIIHDAGKVRNFPLNEKEKNMLAQLVDSTLNIDSNVYLVIQRKTAENMLHFLVHNRFEESNLKATLLIELKSELTDLGHKIKKLITYNQNTYRALYSKIIKEL